MSKASADYLINKFHDSATVRVIYDEDGSTALEEGVQYDVILLISVVHHIPDYLKTIAELCARILRPGGALLMFQDPLWYPRQKRWARVVSWAAYFAWRICQGNFRQGLATRWRRLRRVYSDTEPSDLVEYHVVRDGVDEVAIEELLRPGFETIELERYFSTQSPVLQKIGDLFMPPNTFGILARKHFKN
jgi:SAM-dependent methyltransferase